LFSHIIRSKSFSLFLALSFGLVLVFFVEKAIHTQIDESQKTLKLFKSHSENIEKVLVDNSLLLRSFQGDEELDVSLISKVRTGLLLVNDNHQKIQGASWGSEELEQELENKYKPFYKAHFLFLRRLDRKLVSGEVIFTKENNNKNIAELKLIAATLASYKSQLLSLDNFLNENHKSIILKHYVSTGVVSFFLITCLLAFGKVVFNTTKEFVDEKKRDKFRVLIVDDEADVLETILENCAGNDQYQFFAALNGVDAMNRLREKNFDLVISDVSMPNMGGIELAKQVTKSINVPIVLMTCNSTVKLSQEVFGQNRVYYIYDKFEVLNNIEKIISNALSEGVSGLSHKKAS